MCSMEIKKADMRVYYDNQSDLLYIRFEDRKQEVMNRRVSEEVVLDIGEGNRIIGIGIMDASRHVALERLLPVDYDMTRVSV